jgi:hypothetical protein
MTIREKLKARMFKARAIAFGFWLLFAAGFLLPKNSPYAFLLLVPFAGFAGTVLYMLFFVRCPKCGARLGQAMNSTSQINFCPGCGVSLESKV